MNQGYNLNFKIPQGPTGPTGPTGPVDSKAIGFMWNSAKINTVFLSDNAPLQVNLWTAAGGLDVKYYDDGRIGILNDGAYKVEYCVVLQVPSATAEDVVTVTVTPVFNQILNESNYTTFSIDNNSLYYFYNISLANLKANDNVMLTIKSDKVVAFNYSVAYLYLSRVADAIQRIPVIST